MGDHAKDAGAGIPAYLDEILDLISDGVYISDHQGRTLKVNAMYERLSGLKRSYLLGRDVKHLVDEGYFNTVLNPTIVKTGKPATSLQISKQGKKLVLTGYPIFDGQGRVALVVTFVRDVTLMTQLREELRSQRELVEKYRTNIQYITEERDLEQPLVARGPAIEKILQQIGKVADTDATVLLLGETGTGKDVFARRTHRLSSRSRMPFIKVDCPTIPEALLESELFGHVPGAFTGARRHGKPGFFEMADGGTLMLDEIGELPLSMQAKLLRVLQDREIVRVGSTRTRRVDVRIIAATNRDLEEEVRRGRFRRDLFYRLRVAVITIPPLRERREEIVPLAQHFLRRYAARYKRDLFFEDAALTALQQYTWPGNIRELENLVQSLVITGNRGRIGLSDLPASMIGGVSASCREIPGPAARLSPAESTGLDLASLARELAEGKRGLKAAMRDIERQVLVQVLEQCGSHTAAARRLGIDRSTLFRKLRSADT